MTKRDVKEATQTREIFYDKLANTFVIDGANFLGRGTDGLVYKEVDTGLITVVKVVTKSVDFDGDADVMEFAEKEREKAVKASKKSGAVKVTKKAE